MLFSVLVTNWELDSSSAGGELPKAVCVSSGEAGTYNSGVKDHWMFAFLEPLHSDQVQSTKTQKAQLHLELKNTSAYNHFVDSLANLFYSDHSSGKNYYFSIAQYNGCSVTVLVCNIMREVWRRLLSLQMSETV